MSTADVYLGFCAVLAQILHILWILAACKAYYNRYFDYKLVLQSVAIVNFLCALIFNWFLDIEVLFPLPALRINGFLKYLPDTMSCRMLTIAVIVSLAALSCLAVLEAVYIRILFLYQKHGWIKSYTSSRRAAAYILTVVLFFMIGAAVSYFDTGDVEVLKKQFPSQNLTAIIEEDEVIHAMTITTQQFHDLVVYCTIFCGFFTFTGVVLCLAVYPVSLRRHNNLNNENVNNEKSFTVMLVIQCLIPILYFGMPFLTAILSWAPTFAHDSSVLRYIPTATWILFPMFNSLSSIYLLEPYRRYIARLFGCTHRNRSVVPSIVVHGVDSARPDQPHNNVIASVDPPTLPVVQEEEEKDKEEVLSVFEPPPRTYPFRLAPIGAESPRRFSIETDFIPTRERRPSVFSRLSYFL